MSTKYKIEILKPQLNDYVYAGLVHVNPENGEKTHVYSKVLETNVNGKMVVEGPEKKPWIVDIKQITPIPINEKILKKNRIRIHAFNPGIMVHKNTDRQNTFD